MKRILFMISLLALAAVSCSKEQMTVGSVGTMSISATTDGADTRTSLSKNGQSYDVVWSAGDRIIVQPKNPNAQSSFWDFTLESGEGTTNGTFTGNGSINWSNYSQVEAYYGISDGWNKEWPSIQHYFGEDVISDSPMVCMMDTEGVEPQLHFVNMGGILRLLVKGPRNVRQITITTGNDCCGDITSVSSAGVVSVSGGKSITLETGGEGVAVSPEGTVFNIAMPAKSYSDVSIKVKDNNGGEYVKTLKTGKTLDIERSKITEASVTFDSHMGHKFVDLGLPSGLLWATCNVGAAQPQDYGRYYAWGETEDLGLVNFGWDKYKWSGNTERTLTKYCTRSEYGEVDNLTTLLPEDDAAHVNWGGNWRMPTEEELIEMIDNCPHELTTEYGGVAIIGYIFYKKKTGSSYYSLSDPHIFLPAAGAREEYGLQYQGEDGYYWTSTVSGEKDCEAADLDFGKSWLSHNVRRRCTRLSVRAVF